MKSNNKRIKPSKKKRQEKVEFSTRIKKLINDDFKRQVYYNRIERVSKLVKNIEPIFFNNGEAGFRYKLNDDVEIIFHLRSEDGVFEYFLEYQGEAEEYGESSYNNVIQEDIRFIREIIDLYD